MATKYEISISTILISRGGEIWEEHTAFRHGIVISTILIGKVKFRGNIELLGMESQYLPF